MRHTTTPRNPGLRRTARLRPTLAVAALAGCSIAAACAPSDQSADVTLDGSPFVAIPKATSAQTQSLRQRALKAAGVVDMYGSGDDFYLAINKRELVSSSQWFLSAYMKQLFP